MTHRIVTDSMAGEFRLLRNRIEAEVHSPAVVMVTSATERDGAELTSYGLAESLSRTHQRTALLTTAQARPEIAVSGDKPPRRRASDRLASDDVSASPGLSIVSVSPERLATISRNSIDDLMKELRCQHDYVVIDAGGLPNNSFGLLLLASADAILIAFLAGRHQTASDRAMLDSIERVESKVLGVVMNDRATIDEFTKTSLKRQPGFDRNVVVPDAPSPVTLTQRFQVAVQRIGKPV